ncbi:AraC family transcriptional regulator [Microlunatus ginsengisoli]|uniref:AraC family transcriptional regulator n=1 Tax=Microlunatus ginsengisoli TaxID=363863 RepID=A0ABP7AWN3_9ACTN
MIETTDSVRSVPGAADCRPEDPLSVLPQVLGMVRLSGAIFFRADFHAPWGYWSPPTVELERALPPGRGSLVMFHIVVEGTFWITMQDGTRALAVPGDVVVMPYADAHTMRSADDTDLVSIASLLPPMPWTEFPRIDYGGDGAPTALVCGFLRGDAVLFDPVLRALPSMFVVHPTGPAASWVCASVDYAMHATGALPRVGSQDQRLSELVFTEVLRIFLTECDALELTGWLAALRDPVVGPAIALIHAAPARAWTVEGLARAAMTSKTVLVERFNSLLGRPPIRYLTEWRLRLASGLLRTTTFSVAEVGAQVGYSSEEAFSRAFKRALGAAPTRWRSEAPPTGW